MDRVYRSKVDWWLKLVIIAGVLAILAGSMSLLITPSKEGVPHIWIFLGMLLMAIFMVWILFSVRYTITAEDLLVQAAFFRWRIPLVQITAIDPTHNPLSSPALSLDRLRITYVRPRGTTRWVMISPSEKDRFLDDLARATGLDRHQDRLVRRS